MAIDYTGSATTGLINRLGKLFHLAKQVDALQTTVVAEAEDVVDSFVSADMWQIQKIQELATVAIEKGALAGMYRDSGVYRDRPRNDVAGTRTPRMSESLTYGSSIAGATTGYMNHLHSCIETSAHNILIEAVRTGLDKPIVGINDALIELIKDMNANGHKVDENTVAHNSGSDATGSSNTGNGTVLVSINMPDWQIGNTTRKPHQSIKAETVYFECQHDESTGSVLGRERFIARGKAGSGKYASSWPSGSGAQQRYNVCSAGQLTGSANLLYNSDFDIWPTSTTCDQWTFSLASGTALSSTAGGQGGALTTNTDRHTVTFGSRGTYALRVNGNNSASHLIQQKMGNNTDGTIGTVTPNTSLLFSMRIRSQDTTITAGKLRAALWDGTSSRVANASRTFDFGASGGDDDFEANLTSSWTHFYGTFDVGEKAIPSDLRFGLDFPTVLQADRSLLIDELVLAYPTQLYPGGPAFLIVRGDTDFKITDNFSRPFTNNFASDFQLYFDKYFGTSSMNLNLPIAGSGTAFDDSTYVS